MAHSSDPNHHHHPAPPPLKTGLSHREWLQQHHSTSLDRTMSGKPWMGRPVSSLKLEQFWRVTPPLEPPPVKWSVDSHPEGKGKTWKGLIPENSSLLCFPLSFPCFSSLSPLSVPGPLSPLSRARMLLFPLHSLSSTLPTP